MGILLPCNHPSCHKEAIAYFVGVISQMQYRLCALHLLRTWLTDRHDHATHPTLRKL